MDSFLIDTGFWYAFFDSTDQYHDKANNIADYLELGKLVLPFPTLYETINTRFSTNKNWINEFGTLLNKSNVVLLPDEDYKNAALQIVLDTKRNLSLVDTVLRLILDDDTLKIKYLVTFNGADFFDVCMNRNIQIID